MRAGRVAPGSAQGLHAEVQVGAPGLALRSAPAVQHCHAQGLEEVAGGLERPGDRVVEPARHRLRRELVLAVDEELLAGHEERPAVALEEEVVGEQGGRPHRFGPPHGAHLVAQVAKFAFAALAEADGRGRVGEADCRRPAVGGKGGGEGPEGAESGSFQEALGGVLQQPGRVVPTTGVEQEAQGEVGLPGGCEPAGEATAGTGGDLGAEERSRQEIPQRPPAVLGAHDQGRVVGGEAAELGGDGRGDILEQDRGRDAGKACDGGQTLARLVAQACEGVGGEGVPGARGQRGLSAARAGGGQTDGQRPSAGHLVDPSGLLRITEDSGGLLGVETKVVGPVDNRSPCRLDLEEGRRGIPLERDYEEDPCWGGCHDGLQETLADGVRERVDVVEDDAAGAPDVSQQVGQPGEGDVVHVVARDGVPEAGPGMGESPGEVAGGGGEVAIGGVGRVPGERAAGGTGELRGEGGLAVARGGGEDDDVCARRRAEAGPVHEAVEARRTCLVREIARRSRGRIRLRHPDDVERRPRCAGHGRASPIETSGCALRARHQL